MPATQSATPFLDKYTSITNGAKEMGSSAKSAILANSDLATILSVGMFAFFLILMSFWWGFSKGGNLYIKMKSDPQDRQKQPNNAGNMGWLFFLPLVYLFAGLILYILVSKFANLIWDIKFHNELKLFIEFTYEAYKSQLNAMGTGQQFGHFLAVAIDSMAKGTVLFMLFIPVFILACSLIFSLAIVSNTMDNNQAGSHGKKNVLLIIGTVFVVLIVYIFYGNIINLVYFGEGNGHAGINRNGGSFGTLPEMVVHYLKEAVRNGLT